MGKFTIGGDFKNVRFVHARSIYSYIYTVYIYIEREREGEREGERERIGCSLRSHQPNDGP